MLQGLFNYDNPVWRFIGKLGDLILLNLLWLICCIPVFTAGAATTAVYYVTLKLVRDEDDSTIRSFLPLFFARTSSRLQPSGFYSLWQERWLLLIFGLF